MAAPVLLGEASCAGRGATTITARARRVRMLIGAYYIRLRGEVTTVLPESDRYCARLAGGAAFEAGGTMAEAGGTGSSVPFNENSHRLSPRGDPPNWLPAEYATTYWVPSYSNTLAGAFTPAPVWNSHRRLPFEESIAVRRPSFLPTNTRPPAVAIEPL